MNTATIYGDTRDNKAPLFRLNKVRMKVEEVLPNVIWVEEALTFGDYGFLAAGEAAGAVLIEVKTTRDLINSLAGRVSSEGKVSSINEQLSGLTEEAVFPILLVEGNVGQVFSYKAKRHGPSYPYSWLANALLEWQLAGVYLENTTTTRHTAVRIVELYRWFGKEEHSLLQTRPAKLRVDRTKVTPQMQLLVGGVPGMSVGLAERILERFGSPGAFFAATVKERQMVKGIGKRKAMYVDEMLR